MRIIVTILTLALALAADASAAPLDLRQVSADAKWLMHVDVDAARDSKTGGQVQQYITKSEMMKRRLQWTRESMGIDLSKDLHGVLAYDTKFARYRGVMIIQADIDTKRATEYIAKLSNYKKTTHGKHTLHAWADRRGHGGKTYYTLVCFTDKLAVISHDEGEVTAALDVLDGKKPNLAGADSTLKGDTPEGAILQLRAADFAGEDIPFKSPVVRQSDFVFAVAGELKNEAFARMRMIVKSSEAAEQTAAVFNGFLAMAKMQAANDGNEEAGKILDAVEVNIDKTTVIVSWRGTPDVLLKMAAKKMADHQKEMRDKYHKHHKRTD